MPALICASGLPEKLLQLDSEESVSKQKVAFSGAVSSAKTETGKIIAAITAAQSKQKNLRITITIPFRDLFCIYEIKLLLCF
jgi:hypothetical protein